MKKTNDRCLRIWVAGLLLLVLLLTAGCAGNNAEPTSAAAGTTQPPQTTEPAAATTAAPTTEPTTEPETEPTEPPVIITVEDLRQQMAGTNQRFAIAYFGEYRKDRYNNYRATDPYEAMQSAVPELCRQMPFLLEIPKERVVGEEGELFCVIPLDPEASVKVTKLSGSDIPIYTSQTGEPFLMFSDVNHRVMLSISDSSGEALCVPQIGLYDTVYCDFYNGGNESWFRDFSDYREMLLVDYAKKLDNSVSARYRLPTEEDLTKWAWDGYFVTSTRRVSYYLLFKEDTFSVQWRGSDKVDRALWNAGWKLTYEEGYAVLTVNTGSLAGIRRYFILYDKRNDGFYTTVDLLQEELPLGEESLTGYIDIQSIQPNHYLCGDWKLIWTEMDGVRTSAIAGQQKMSIRKLESDEEGVYVVSYKNRESPKENFKRRFRVVWEDLHFSCGSVRWVAKMAKPWEREKEYVITAIDYRTLLVQCTWEENGETKVRYDWYRDR